MRILINENIILSESPVMDGMGIYVSNKRGSFTDMYLFDNNVRPIAQIILDKITKDVFTVRWAWAIEGNGGNIYEIAMNHVHPNALVSDRELYGNEKAMNIWKKMYNRPDVKKEPIAETDVWYRKFDDKERTFYLNFKYSLSSPALSLKKMVDDGTAILSANNIENPDNHLWNSFLDISGY